MPRLGCTYRHFLDILEANGFTLLRHDGGSHQRLRGVVGGEVRLVTLAPHSWSDDVPLGTLQSMIRQSGLPKSLFRR